MYIFLEYIKYTEFSILVRLYHTIPHREYTIVCKHDPEIKFKFWIEFTFEDFVRLSFKTRNKYDRHTDSL